MQTLVEGRRAKPGIAASINHERTAVENEFVLAANHIDIDQGHSRFSHPGSNDLFTLCLSAGFIRRSIDRDDALRTCRAAGGDRLRIPDVFADLKSNANAIDAEHGGVLARPEVTFLVKHTVIRQFLLAVMTK